MALALGLGLLASSVRLAQSRSAADAPEIDGLVYVAKARKLKAGEFAQVRITRADTHDLHGEPAP